MTQSDGTLPLSRFTVLDLTRVRAGPTCVRQLADWGAAVLKVEIPEAVEGRAAREGPRDGADGPSRQRNKRASTRNVKDGGGLALCKRMVEKTDVVVENYRPDVKFRLGVDYESLSAINPRLVYGSISGFGEDGPYRERPGFDQIAQGMGGLMSITGQPGQGPMRAGIPIADLTAGLFCAMGILTALLEREVSGKGQWVRTSLLQAQVFMLDFQAARWLVDQETPLQAGNNHPVSIPTGVFPTSDGHINIASAGQVIWERLCQAIETEHLLEDPRYADGPSRSDNRDALNEALGSVTVKYSSEALISLLNEAGVPCGPIYSIDQVFADPQVKHLEMAQSVTHHERGEIELVAQPFTLSRTPTRLRTAIPERGADTDSVLSELGLNSEEIKGLRERNIV